MAANSGDGLKSLVETAQENVKRLGACKGGHEFDEVPHDLVRFGKRYECRKCGGKIDRSAMYWYKLGLEHGAKK